MPDQPTAAPSAPPTFYLPSEVAAILRCSTWWVKDQARRRKIPYCWIGGGYKFTPEHLAEIARMCEVRPADPPAPVSRATPVRDPASDESAQPGLRLVARPPRRTRAASGSTSFAA